MFTIDKRHNNNIETKRWIHWELHNILIINAITKCHFLTIPSCQYDNRQGSHTYPSQRLSQKQSSKKMSSLCSLTLWDQSVLAAVEVVGRSDIQQYRHCFVVMNVSSLWAQRYILGPVKQQGDCAGGCWDGTERSLAIVDCVDARIMFARLLGQNSLSHTEVNGGQLASWKRYHKMCFVFFSLWWLLSEWVYTKTVIQSRLQIYFPDLDSNRYFFLILLFISSPNQ